MISPSLAGSEGQGRRSLLHAQNRNMRIIKSIEKLSAFRHPTCLTIGMFDGVHLGHQQVIRRVVEKAATSGLTSVVMTFDAHPRSSLGKGLSPPLLTCTAHKLSLMEKLGMDVCLVAKLDRSLASMSARDFVMEILVERLRVAGVVAGPRLRFGKDRSGTPALLKELGDELGFWVEVVGEVFVKGVPVSSTVVRRKILEGNLPAAELFLGRRFSIVGRVVRGRTVGRKLGYRTANINPLDQIIPPRGVYSVEVVVSGGTHPGALNVGSRPTFSAGEDSPPVLEVHILDFDKPIYGKRVEVIFHRRLRDERRFASPDELARQIATDIEEVKQYFRTEPGFGGLGGTAAGRGISLAGNRNY